MGEVQLSLQEFRQFCDKALGAIAEDVGGNVALHADYYWSIPREELYDVYREPSELTVARCKRTSRAYGARSPGSMESSSRKRSVGSVLS